MLTSGLDGATMTTSPSAIASSTPGAGRDSSMPWKWRPRTSSCHWRRTKYSWNESSPPSVATVVRTRSSLIGSSRQARP